MTTSHHVANFLLRRLLKTALTPTERADCFRLLATTVFPTPRPGAQETIVPHHDPKFETVVRARFSEDGAFVAGNFERRLSQPDKPGKNVFEWAVEKMQEHTTSVPTSQATPNIDTLERWIPEGAPPSASALCYYTRAVAAARKDVECAIRRTADTWSEVLEAERAAWATEKNKLLDNWKAQVDEMRGTLNKLRAENEWNAQLYGRDWTAVDGRSNNSPEYMEISAQVEALIRDNAHALLAGKSGGVACHIVSHLAHKLGMRPMRKEDTQS